MLYGITVVVIVAGRICNRLESGTQYSVPHVVRYRPGYYTAQETNRGAKDSMHSTTLVLIDTQYKRGGHSQLINTNEKIQSTQVDLIVDRMSVEL